MGKKNDSKVKEHAAWMKRMGVRRTTGCCPMCYRMVHVPMDNHFVACKIK